MSNNVTLVYQFTPTGASASTLQNDVQGVAVPPDLLYALGLRVTSDTTAATGTSVTRTIVMAFGPSSTGSATATIAEGQVTAVTEVTVGNDYVVAPVVQLTGGGVGGLTPGSPAPFPDDDTNPDNQIVAGVVALAQAYLKLAGTTIPAGDAGSGYSAGTTIGFVGGLPPALFLGPQPAANKYAEANTDLAPVANGPPYAVNAISVNQNRQGFGYSTDTVVQIIGGSPTIPAQAIISEFGVNGEIISVQVIDPGEGYLTIPQIVFFDPDNPNVAGENDEQPQACALMGAGTPPRATLTIGGGGNIAEITITTQGDGLLSLPTVVINDPADTGSGAVVIPRLGLSSFKLRRGGRGYQTAPTVVLVPYFKAQYPDTSNQEAPFFFFMTNALKMATNADCTSEEPALT